MRPGGLTALAVFNFVFGGLGALQSLAGLALVGEIIRQAEQAARQGGPPAPNAGLLYLMLGIGAVQAGILITSGVGYLTRKRVVGWLFGNLYAVVALLVVVLTFVLTPTQFTIVNLISFAYPLITLFLLNVIFRKDFVR
jgi:hypothetical protein